MNPHPALEFRRATPEHTPGLTAFFQRLAADSEASHFHPHPFTLAEAEKICGYSGKDLYLVATFWNQVLAYGLLRGWDEGYTIPSLGIAVDASTRGSGLGLSFMRYLHSAAASLGAETIRLKVYADNVRAKSLYEKLGYEPAGESAGQLVYTLKLKPLGV